MCGIVGTVGGQMYPMMTHSIKHRGRYIYSYVDTEVQCDFVHLPILDYLHGKQPYEYNGWFVWFNGEIYNYKELSVKYGIPLYTRCDGEIIAKLIDLLGVVEATKQFNGMFVIFAKRGQDSFLIRDRYGIKPIYYTYINNKIYFSSEFKAFTHHPQFKRELDYKALHEYLTYQNILSDRTLYKNVKLLPPATILYIKGGYYYEYWKPEFKAEKMDFEEAKREVRRLLNQSIKRQLQSDVPIGQFLSGGIDSNIIRGLAGKGITHTYTVGYTDGKSEHELAEITRHNNHTTLMIHKDSIKSIISDTIYHLEDLRAGSCYANYLLYGAVADSKRTVVLQGTGGDELFGGYKHRYNLNDSYKTILNRCRYFDDEVIEWHNDSLNKRMEFDFRHFMHGLLIVGDKLSMAHTLEDRVPFLDNDLVDFALTIPNSMKEDKWILKAACIDVLPEKILNAPKWGFTSPEHIWFEQNRDWIKGELKNVYDVLHVSKKENVSLTWSLISLEYWIRHYLL